MQLGSQIAGNASKQAFKGGRPGRLAKELTSVARSVTREALQDHATLKQNTLILSSLMVSLSRVFRSHKSALQARHTEDGPFRYKEAIKTTIRELGGWTFSFMVFRAFQNLAKRGFRKMVGAEPHPSIIATGKEDLKQAFRNFSDPENAQRLKPIELKRSYNLNIKPENLPKMERFYKRFKVDSLYKLFKKAPVLTLTDKMVRLDSLYKMLPIGIGMIPAVLLSGFFLESFTQKHSQSVVEYISNKFNPASSGKTNNNPSSPSSFSPAQPNAINNDFDAFMRAVR